MLGCDFDELYARHTKIWISQGVDWISTASGSERSLRQRSLATARGTDSSSQSRSWCAQHIAYPDKFGACIARFHSFRASQCDMKVPYGLFFHSMTARRLRSFAVNAATSTS